MSKKSQEGGDYSTNIQADAITITQGVSLADVRALALDIFRANFLELAGQAANVARARAEEITEKFLEELQKQHQEGLKQAQDPDFQYSLYTAQREYARSGDKELGDLLVDLLVDRTRHDKRSILQIVLNESLLVVPKLTTDQLAALSVIFIFRYTFNRGVNNLEGLAAYLDLHVQPFVGLLSKKSACFRHLEYSGCGAIGITAVEIAEVFRINYPGLFSKGFTTDIPSARGIALTPQSPMFTRCLHNPERVQINAVNEDALRDKAEKLGLASGDTDKLVALATESLMNQEEVKDYLTSARPYMSSMIDAWEDSPMKNFTLTSVGIAIGHANVKKNLDEFTDLSIWIN